MPSPSNPYTRYGTLALFTFIAGLLGGAFAHLTVGWGRSRLMVELIQAQCIGFAIMLIFISLRRLFARQIGGRLGGLLMLVAVSVPLGIEAGLHVYGLLLGRSLPLGVMLTLPNATLTRALAIAFSGASLLIYILWSQQRLADAAAAQADVQRLAVETQLRLLQAQIEPHMLFNTLATLHTLIEVDAPRAQTMVEQLIIYLRRTLSASRRDTSSLGDEFALLRTYLDLMSIRMGPRLHTQLHLPDELAALPFPPMLLQPLVENAIKHGLEPKVAGGSIVIRAELKAEQLLVSVMDSGVGLRDEPSDGYGLQHVRERLQALYGPRACLIVVANVDGGTCASVSLPR